MHVPKTIWILLASLQVRPKEKKTKPKCSCQCPVLEYSQEDTNKNFGTKQDFYQKFLLKI